MDKCLFCDNEVKESAFCFDDFSICSACMDYVHTVETCNEDYIYNMDMNILLRTIQQLKTRIEILENEIKELKK